MHRIEIADKFILEPILNGKLLNKDIDQNYKENDQQSQENSE